MTPMRFGTRFLGAFRRTVVPLALLFGIVSAALGYYVSWIEQLPTGATMVVVASVFLLPGLARLAKRSTI